MFAAYQLLRSFGLNASRAFLAIKLAGTFVSEESGIRMLLEDPPFAEFTSTGLRQWTDYEVSHKLSQIRFLRK